MQQISLCVPTWNRNELLFKSFEHVIDDERIGEVIIVDDYSHKEIYEQIKERAAQYPKIKLFRNIENKDCYENKMISVSFATNPFVILFDSDNILMPDYLNKIYEHIWEEDTILAPSFAKPTYSYRDYSNLIITKQNISSYVDMPMFITALNTSNFFCNRDRYLKNWDNKVNPHTADTIYFCYCWLKDGGKIHIVKDLEYFHLVHPNSHYQNNVHKTGNFLQEVIKNLKQLS